MDKSYNHFESLETYPQPLSAKASEANKANNTTTTFIFGEKNLQEAKNQKSKKSQTEKKWFFLSDKWWRNNEKRWTITKKRRKITRKDNEMKMKKWKPKKWGGSFVVFFVFIGKEKDQWMHLSAFSEVR